MEELRRRIIVCFVAFVLSLVVGWVFAWDILEIVKKPAQSIVLHYMGPMEPFLVRFKLAFFVGLLIAAPVIIFELMGFVIPALKREEKKIAIFALLMILFFFCAGVAFGYRFIIPPAITWLLGVAGTQMKPVLSAGQYISFIGWFMLGIGIAFETPVVIWMLVAMDVVTPEQLQRQWRVAVIVILVASSIITPDWNPVTMFLVALPMLGLYLISLGLARLTARRRKKVLMPSITDAQ
ncbi:MAG: twin-arginine translocase subunit TatC [Actinomycetota bacterium]|nr:twin-arginine translocase subunit TatC [Actinomycetota bacterium]